MAVLWHDVKVRLCNHYLNSHTLSSGMHIGPWNFSTGLAAPASVGLLVALTVQMQPSGNAEWHDLPSPSGTLSVGRMYGVLLQVDPSYAYYCSADAVDLLVTTYTSATEYTYNSRRHCMTWGPALHLHRLALTFGERPSPLSQQPAPRVQVVMSAAPAGFTVEYSTPGISAIVHPV